MTNAPDPAPPAEDAAHDGADDAAPSGKKRTALVVGIVAVVAVLAVGGGLWWFFRDDAPERVDIDSAVGNLDDGEDSADDTSGSDLDVTGTWTVDPAVTGGDGGSFAGYRVDEELATIGSNTAVGRSPDVSGTIELDGSTLVSGDFTVDLTTITSDDDRRDGRARDALNTDEFPEATFTVDGPVDLGSLPTEGESLAVEVPGTFTINGTTQDAVVELSAQVVDDTLTVVGTTPIVFADYGIEAPTAPLVLSISDEGEIEWQLYLTTS